MYRKTVHTPNANMADHSVGARDESHESEVSQALMFCFDNALGVTKQSNEVTSNE